ncbi:Hsp20/alpha crystallin family protein [Maritimibacter fusiformis]|uniref:Hsp20/alpha crystallin family protein n=1 Tax=Maritimibacter fusiformis TaxID=2603819 RepID=A0A5D0RR47_9RHOB|nr:Hsp20/alpha crystallin family protein [Maritimibacter fusiformis]TYB83148.1 Hsp20/alpha crystallin family protein [Maritimibacter fusiformis]
MVEKSQSGLWPSLYDPFKTFGTRLAEFLSPASDAKLAEDVYTITLELPGVEEKDIDLTVNDGVVQVRGEKKSEREEKGETWYFSERQFGSFSRSFRLPPDADASKIEAGLKDGVLTVTVPKSAPKSAEAKTIKIKKS